MPTTPEPDSTAVRVALWRALHLLVDPSPHILTDDIGLRLADPEPGWRDRGDMDPTFTAPMRAATVARSRYLDDLIDTESARGTTQYVLLGAGLDSFAQRRPDIAERITIFEVDQPEPQAWKQQRLRELGLPVPTGLRFVPVDFETDSWWDRLRASGFDTSAPAVVASTGVSMYLTDDANTATLRRVATLAPGSTFAMTYLLPPDAVDPDERPGFDAAIRGAATSGTPFLSLYTADRIIAAARDAGFNAAQHISADDHTRRYFADRTDGLRPGSGEQILLATT